MPFNKSFWAVLSALTLMACSEKGLEKATSATQINTENKIETQDDQDLSALDYIEHAETYNYEAPIPAQCYTKTESVHNPCYVCHQTYKDSQRPNHMNDGFQQGSYAFSEVGERNSWKNLFKDRSKDISQVSDEEILNYIAEDNYSPMIDWMKSDKWRGVVPEIKDLAQGAKAFDQNGLALDGSRWVAFNYKPLPSTFWPTNGSTDDTFIQLPEQYSSLNGEFSKDIYYVNLALLEMAIAGTQQTSTIPINESIIKVDINNDGKLSKKEEQITRRENFVGDASEQVLTHMLYPEGTAFLHTVRYIGIDDKGEVFPAQRMKEVRYMQKKAFISKERLANRYYKEFKEKHFEQLPKAIDKKDQGTSNGFGWLLWGFIENEHGHLRKQHREEQFFCVGCHKTVGTTIDQTFGFPRKVAGAKGWAYINLKDIQDVPNVGEKGGQVEGEYLTYLQRVGGGDEFRQNTEMLGRWFNKDGSVNKNKVAALDSIFPLITPSRERALALNKAYREVVKEQSFLYGRDVVLSPATNVFKEVNTDVAPLEPEFRYNWDIRLDWTKREKEDRALSLLE